MGRRSAWLAGAALAFACACRCDPPSGELTNAWGGFRVETSQVDFGRVLEGDRATRTVTLVSTSRAPQDVRAVAKLPFEVSPRQLTLPPGGKVALEVAFVGWASAWHDELAILSPGDWARVAMDAEGVRPLPCVASGPCRRSTFDLETESCVETRLEDGAACQPRDPCIVNGRCASGVCVGDPRVCDDNNRCTDDACLPGWGCISVTKWCSPPTRPCEISTCSPVTGCGFAPAADFSLCGGYTCSTGSFCVQGACVEVPTPNGFPCAPPTPCQGAGACQSGSCVRPDGGTLAPTFALPVAGGPLARGGDPLLLGEGDSVFASVCFEDGGCALSSWTGNGFERFTAPYADARDREVLAVTGEGVWVLAPDAVELYGRDTGERLSEVPLSALSSPVPGARPWTASNRYAVSSAGELWATVSWIPDAGAELDGGEADAGALDAGELDAGELDAGEPDGGEVDAGSSLPSAFDQTLVRIASDGGSWTELGLVGVGAASLAAMGADDSLYLFDPDAGLARMTFGDAGVAIEPYGPVEAAPTLAVGGEQAMVGGELLFALDGGRIGALPDAGQAHEPAYVVPSPVLLTRTGSFGLYRSCTTPYVEPCAEGEKGTWVRKFDPSTGAVEWGAEVIPGDLPGFVEEMVSVDGGVALISQVFPDGGAEVRVQGFYDGSEWVNCPLEGDARLGSVLFQGTWMYALVERDGGWSFEGYDLTPAPLDFSGWPAKSGASGTRRARP